MALGSSLGPPYFGKVVLPVGTASDMRAPVPTRKTSRGLRWGAAAKSKRLSFAAARLRLELANDAQDTRCLAALPWTPNTQHTVRYTELVRPCREVQSAHLADARQRLAGPPPLSASRARTRTRGPAKNRTYAVSASQETRLAAIPQPLWGCGV